MTRRVKKNVRWDEKTTSSPLRVHRYFTTFTEEEAADLINRFEFGKSVPKGLCDALNTFILPIFFEEKFASDYLPNLTDKKLLLKRLKTNIETLQETLNTFFHFGSRALQLFDGFSSLDTQIMISRSINHAMNQVAQKLSVGFCRYTAEVKEESQYISPSVSSDKSSSKVIGNDHRIDRGKTVDNRISDLKKHLSAMLGYTEAALLRLNKKEYRKAIENQIVKFDNGIKKLSESKEKNCGNNLEIDADINGLKQCKFDAQEILKKIKPFKNAGNTSKKPIYLFVELLRRIYEESSGKRATVNYNNYADEYSSRFLDFVLCCAKIIEDKSTNKNMEGYVSSIFPKTSNAWVAIIKKNNPYKLKK